MSNNWFALASGDFNDWDVWLRLLVAVDGTFLLLRANTCWRNNDGVPVRGFEKVLINASLQPIISLVRLTMHHVKKRCMVLFRRLDVVWKMTITLTFISRLHLPEKALRLFCMWAGEDLEVLEGRVFCILAGEDRQVLEVVNDDFFGINLVVSGIGISPPTACLGGGVKRPSRKLKGNCSPSENMDF